jgi:SAM-dependent methyltransferase
MPEQRTTEEREARRVTFDGIPAAYDAARPTYRPQVIDDVLALGGFAAGSRVAEIGCGTGQATIPLTERGLVMTCVEMGRNMAEFARAKFEPYPTISVVNAPFETWDPAGVEYDGVVSFASFHWVDPAVRFVKAASVLRPGGSLVVVTGRHVRAPGGDPFFEASLPVYRELDGGGQPPPRLDQVTDLSAEFEASGVFGPVRMRRHTIETTRTVDEHLALINTYSPQLMLDDATRDWLLTRLREVAADLGQTTITQTMVQIVHAATRG